MAGRVRCAISLRTPGAGAWFNAWSRAWSRGAKPRICCEPQLKCWECDFREPIAPFSIVHLTFCSPGRPRTVVRVSPAASASRISKVGATDTGQLLVKNDGLLHLSSPRRLSPFPTCFRPHLPIDAMPTSRRTGSIGKGDSLTGQPRQQPGSACEECRKRKLRCKMIFCVFYYLEVRYPFRSKAC